jgi:hypothetical protein
MAGAVLEQLLSIGAGSTATQSVNKARKAARAIME